ncbi:FecR domain-containing protein [Pseudomonas sp. SWRI102]|uniref:FecR domain-containing protein n=1 Tax=Pseudomonas marvdashtae TaxID=2745500 RepID=A0A923JRF0_9PSED|nr:FecR domain-containing protein [Pseudomonas marvdashtae]MBV4550363.1 FecR domain-containing protein [Pseudomonas marvdashtae]
MNTAPNVSAHVAEQAVHWLLEMQQGPLDPRQQQAWEQWLNAHSEHRRAWEHIQRVNQRLRNVSSPLAHAALNAPKRTTRRQALKLLLILGAGSSLAWGLRERQLLPPLMADYRSPVGERRRLTLDDGSQLQLNTGSAVDVRFDAQRRLIRLLEGELQITGARDPRPLQVATAHGLLESQSARFNVREFPGHTQVAVFEGQVQGHGHQGAPFVLTASRQLGLGINGAGPPTALDANSGAWTEGMLVAAHMRLTDFLDELSRYRRGQLHCDEAVANLLISGSYPLDNSERILDLLEVSLPVTVRRFTRYWVSVEARA